MKKRLGIIIAIIVGGIALYRIGVFVKAKISPPPKKVVIKKIPVKAVAAKKMDMTVKLRLNGNIKGIEAVKIYPHVPGKIQYILVKEGEKVRKGQYLFKIDRDIIGMEFRLAPVESPISGFMGKISVDRGMTVSQSTPLAEVVNMSSIEAIVELVEEDINRVRVGMHADIRVRAYPKEIFDGTVYKKSAILDQLSRTQEVRIRLKNPGLRLNHGMFADVDIILDKKKNVIAVPVDALFKDQEGAQCIYKVKDLTAILQKIRTGIQVNNFQEVLEGIDQGDVVITLGHENVSNGDQLIVYREDMNNREIKNHETKAQQIQEKK